jgi:hypothetical protein
MHIASPAMKLNEVFVVMLFLQIATGTQLAAARAAAEPQVSNKHGPAAHICQYGFFQ